MDKEEQEYWFAVLKSEIMTGNQILPSLIKATHDTAEVFKWFPESEK